MPKLYYKIISFKESLIDNESRDENDVISPKLTKAKTEEMNNIIINVKPDDKNSSKVGLIKQKAPLNLSVYFRRKSQLK